MEQKNLLKHLRVSITTECNKKCWYCFSEGIHEKKEKMSDIHSFGWLMGVLKESFDTVNVRFTGGEPLLNENLVQFVKETKKNGINNIGVTTNGIYLSEKFETLCEAGVNNFAIHITDIDDEKWDIQEFENCILKQNNIRYNVVVTKSNYERVIELLNIAYNQKINLLLLDLLESDYTTKKAYHLEYIDLNILEKTLQLFNYHKYIQNKNSIVFYNENNTVKLVKRYVDRGGERYCTKELDMHPVLLSSDFNFRLCNHFGTKEIHTCELIERRNKKQLIEKINQVLWELKACEECTHKLILS